MSAEPTMIDGAIGDGMCQIVGCPEKAIGALMWKHLAGVPEGQANFCSNHRLLLQKVAFMALWREFAVSSEA